jgi:hypothetical protein
MTRPIPWVPPGGEARHPACFMAVVEHPLDPGPPLPLRGRDFHWDYFRAFQRGSNKVAWRNVCRVPMPVQPPPRVGLPFLIQGAPDGERTFDLEVIRELSATIQVELRMPAALGARMREASLDGTVVDADGVAVLRVPDRPRFHIRDLRLPSHGTPCGFVVSGTAQGAPLRLAIRQLDRGEEVGRITWRAGPP